MCEDTKHKFVSTAPQTITTNISPQSPYTIVIFCEKCGVIAHNGNNSTRTALYQDKLIRGGSL